MTDTTPYHLAKIEIDPSELKFFTPGDKASSLSLSGERLFMCQERNLTLTIAHRSATRLRYTSFVRVAGSTDRWKFLTETVMDRPDDYEVDPRIEKSVIPDGTDPEPFHFTPRLETTAANFNRRFGGSRQNAHQES